MLLNCLGRGLADVVRVLPLAVLFQMFPGDIVGSDCGPGLVIRHDFRAIGQADEDARVHLDLAQVKRHQHFADVVEQAEFALIAFAIGGDVERPEHDVLRRRDDRAAVGRREDVVRRQHQHVRFRLRFDAERKMDGHLVAVKVGVEAFADERVNLDGVAFDQHRLKRLDAHAVKRGGAIEHHRVLIDDFFKNVPDFRIAAFEHLLGGLDRVGQAMLLELADDERLEQFQRDLLRQAALMQLEFRSDDDDRTSRVIDALAEQIFAEAALLALDHVGQGLQRAIGRTQHRTTAAAVVEQRIDSLLKHALFVADDDFRRIEIDQLFQPIIAVDDSAIQIIQIRRGEVAGFQQNQRSQVRRDHGDHVHDHPLGLVFRAADGFHHLQPLGEVLDLLLAVGLLDVGADLDRLDGEIDHAEQFLDRLGAHLRFELVLSISRKRRDIRPRSEAASFSAASCPDW